MSREVFILGGAQTDFARNVTREGGGLFELIRDASEAAFAATGIAPEQVETVHIGNFVGELFAGQGQLGGFMGHVHPALAGVPAARHEAACASGSIAALAASAEIEAGRYGLALVVGVELMRNVPGRRAAEYLGAAAWAGQEAQDATYVWPHIFSGVADEYDRRYGLDRAHLRAISANAFANARRNPLAQTRGWTVTPDHLGDDDMLNPVIEGRLRKSDCGQVTDGAAAIFLASAEVARAYAERTGQRLDTIPRITGWGHSTAPLSFTRKLADSRDAPFVFPFVRRAMMDALGRAGLADIHQVDGLEVHDCFSITQYMAIDHFGLTPPGQSWRAVEDGTIALGGRLPVNPSGGLIGLGHPVGATGVRMLLDAARQVSGRAGDCQVEGARRFATFNVGGSATTSVCFVVGV
ncbi:thiolase domain-containing protein [Sphingomonas changnyeongensis]|uniref:Thiolase domain-containing protein n=1 Tax=Sphingomonas changnyeongensis TaxID=2698679 RepID=A0A7Z2NXH3_9SPHN|nr:acetyl-CoA acetyltransferase [Sphingomonas changnyeongensis]QHL91224.1 thiolase domain-containing protein [Sphingomonas changnyeongensis]